MSAALASSNFSGGGGGGGDTQYLSQRSLPTMLPRPSVILLRLRLTDRWPFRSVGLPASGRLLSNALYCSKVSGGNAGFACYPDAVLSKDETRGLFDLSSIVDREVFL